jgi:hypothetical protein
MDFELAWQRPTAPPPADEGRAAGLAAVLRRAAATSFEA